MSEREHNWAGNYTYATDRVHVPASVAELQELVRRSRKVRALGSRHSFNGIADSNEEIISLARLDRVLSLDAEQRTVTIEGGVRYGQLGEHVHRAGFALHNLASLPHISVAGACATATHGSGERNGNLAVAVSAMEFVSAAGDIVVASRARTGNQFEGMPVSLGAFGIITKLTLDLVPTFHVRQDVYDELPFSQVAEHFDTIASSGYSTSLFTSWGSNRTSQVWIKRVTSSSDSSNATEDFVGARKAPTNRHPIPGISAESCTPQMGIPGPWHERLPHFRMDFTPSSGEELQSEYFVPRTHAVAALEAILALGPQISPLLLISEVRTIAADELWMSPCYRQDCIAIHFTWRPDWSAVQRALPQIEAALAAFQARPHWGKLFTMPSSRVRSLYERLPDFRDLVTSLDPTGKFRNAFLDSFIFGGS